MRARDSVRAAILIKTSSGFYPRRHPGIRGRVRAFRRAGETGALRSWRQPTRRKAQSLADVRTLSETPAYSASGDWMMAEELLQRIDIGIAGMQLLGTPIQTGMPSRSGICLPPSLPVGGWGQRGTL
jgi:hypothetical protein